MILVLSRITLGQCIEHVLVSQDPVKDFIFKKLVTTFFGDVFLNSIVYDFILLNDGLVRNA